MADGTVGARVNVEDFSLCRLERAGRAEVDRRRDVFRAPMSL
ncbi:MAG TPA: hypothetical protein VF590_02180 [Isosphaeraceae bacterium]|jgi:hypothetical protein